MPILKNLKAKLTQNIEIVRKNKDCVTKKNAKKLHEETT